MRLRSARFERLTFLKPPALPVDGYLGYSRYEDKGQFPDIRHQLLEVKLQTSPTIDLGLVLPSSTENP